MRLAWVALMMCGVLSGCAAPADPGPLAGRLVDLTHPFDDQTIYWPTASGFELEIDSRGPTDGGYWYEANSFSTSEIRKFVAITILDGLVYFIFNLSQMFVQFVFLAFFDGFVQRVFVETVRLEHQAIDNIFLATDNLMSGFLIFFIVTDIV